MIGRLEPVFVGLERQQCPVLVIAHHAVLKVIACYFGDKSPEEVPSFSDMKQHAVLKVTPQAYGCNAELFQLYPESNTVAPHPLDR